MKNNGQERSTSSALDSNSGTDERTTAGQLALEIMHEIRNPLETLGHLTYLAHEEANDPEQVRKYMRMAEEQIRAMSRIANQTLSFAKLSQTAKPVDLVTLAEAALRIHQRTMEAKHIHLVRRLPENLTAEVQEARILQVLSNLIANAIEAMPEGGHLALRLKKRDGRIELLVADNGHGIDPANHDKLFEPFFSTKGESGNGLGLSLTKRIVEDHSGRLSVRSSVRSGRSGSVFKVVLPTADDRATTKDRQAHR